MGGAERNARKRRQQRTSVGKAASASAGVSRVTIVAIAAVVVLAAVVVGGVIWSKSGSDGTSGKEIPVADAPGKLDEKASRDGVSVVRGSEDATADIDIYEDFMCPACGQFEASYGDQIEQRIESGELRVRYHVLPMLMEYSNPAGYSLESANAALCAADEGKFERFHDSLFESQPNEGGRGYDDDQLTQLGRDMGIEGNEFAQCVADGEYDDELNEKLDDVLDNPDLKSDKGGGGASFGTPTVTSDGEIVDTSGEWLAELIEKHED